MASYLSRFPTLPLRPPTGSGQELVLEPGTVPILDARTPPTKPAGWRSYVSPSTCTPDAIRFDD